MDNLNTHTGASLYKAFEPKEARRILEKLEIHYTPKQGSCLNMAEIELSILSRQSMDRRIPDQETLKKEIFNYLETCLNRSCVFHEVKFELHGHINVLNVLLKSPQNSNFIERAS